MSWGFVWPLPKQPDYKEVWKIVSDVVKFVNTMPLDDSGSPTWGDMSGVELIKHLLGDQ